MRGRLDNTAAVGLRAHGGARMCLGGLRQKAGSIAARGVVGATVCRGGVWGREQGCLARGGEGRRGESSGRGAVGGGPYHVARAGERGCGSRLQYRYRYRMRSAGWGEAVVAACWARTGGGCGLDGLDAQRGELGGSREGATGLKEAETRGNSPFCARRLEPALPYTCA